SRGDSADLPLIPELGLAGVAVFVGDDDRGGAAVGAVDGEAVDAARADLQRLFEDVDGGFVPGVELVAAGRDVADGEGAVAARLGVIDGIDHVEVTAHRRVDVAQQL